GMESKIEGIYESNVPPLFQALYQIGASASCSQVENIIDSSNLTMTKNKFDFKLNTAFIYHSFFKDYGIMGLFKGNELTVYVLNQSETNFDRYFKDSKFKFEVVYLKNKKDAI